MKRFAILLVLLLVASGAPVGALTGSNYSHLVLKDGAGFRDIREFGAKGDGVTDNATAFASAAAWVNSKGGGETLFFASGTYLVVPGGAATPAGSRDLWKAFSLASCSDVRIYGEPGTKIVSSIDVGSATANGKSMDLFYFSDCHNVAVDGLNIDITVTGDKNPADMAYPELVVAIHFNHAVASSCESIVRNCTLKVSNPLSGNGLKQGNEFMTVWVQGGGGTGAYSPYLQGITIKDCLFPDGQGPVVWGVLTDRLTVDSCRFVDCGGPLPTVRLTLQCSNVSVVDSFFRMKQQVGQTSATDHNYPVYQTGRSYAATEPASVNFKVIGNTFRTLGGQAVVMNGARGVLVSDNIIHRESTDTGTNLSGSIAVYKTDYEECQDVVISNNTFSNISNDGAVQIFGAADNVTISGNVFRACKYGVYAAGAPTGISITGNVFADGTNNQVYLASLATSTNVVAVSGNTFSNNLGMCIVSASGDSSSLGITGNSFRTNGINASGPFEATIINVSGQVSIADNVLRDSKGIAIYSLGSSNNGANITGNRVIGSGREAIYFSGSYANIANNQILNCNQRLLEGVAGIQVGTGTNNINVTGNSILDTGGLCAYGIWMASCTNAIAIGNNLYNSANVATGTSLATGTSGVVEANNGVL